MGQSWFLQSTFFREMSREHWKCWEPFGTGLTTTVPWFVLIHTIKVEYSQYKNDKRRKTSYFCNYCLFPSPTWRTEAISKLRRFSTELHHSNIDCALMSFLWSELNERSYCHVQELKQIKFRCSLLDLFRRNVSLLGYHRPFIAKIQNQMTASKWWSWQGWFERTKFTSRPHFVKGLAQVSWMQHVCFPA